jgi:hypothetical protein
MVRRSWLIAEALNSDGIHNKLPGMNFKPSHPLGPCMLVTAMFVGTMAFSTATLAQSEPAELDSQKSMTVLPLEQSASRGITTRDPSSVIKCNDEYWVFYTVHIRF